MVDADAVVPLPGAGLVVPEGVAFGRAVDGQEGLGETQPLQRPEGLAALGLEEGVLGPVLGIGGVARLGDDVEVARQDQRFLIGQQVAGMGVQARPPRRS